MENFQWLGLIIIALDVIGGIIGLTVANQFTFDQGIVMFLAILVVGLIFVAHGVSKEQKQKKLEMENNEL